MDNAKILLPSTKVRGRGKSTPKNRNIAKKTNGNRRKNIPASVVVADEKQRNEALGLILIGLSAFSLALLHYISSSKISSLVNFFIVYFGMGVYILPLLACMFGIQKFFDREFANLPWRILGIIGTMVSGLALLGLEGGKLGVYTFRSAENLFGVIPSKILFFTLLTASLIFALDLLYKDVLAFLAMAAGIAMRVFVFLWEMTISLVSMTINATKTTAAFVCAIYNKTKEVYMEYREAKIAEEAEKAEQLLSSPAPAFMKKREEAKTSVETLKEKALKNMPEEEDATIVEASHSDEVSVCSVCAAEAAAAESIPEPEIILGGVPVETLIAAEAESEAEYDEDEDEDSGERLDVMVTLDERTANPMFLRKEVLSSKTESSQNMKAVSLPVSSSHQTWSDEVALPQETTSVETTRKAEAVNKSEDVVPKVEPLRKISESEDETVYLDDNLIDLELKNLPQSPSEELPEEAYVKEVMLPPLELLMVPPPPKDTNEAKSELSEQSAALLKTLDDFGIKASVTAIVQGPAVSRFELRPAPGVKVSKITSLADDIALSLAAASIRIEAPIPGKSALGIEIPNKKPSPVYFYDLVKNEKFYNENVLLNLALGVTINGQPVYADLSDMPHLLIAGSTGSGKSVCVNTIIASILFRARPDEVKFIMIDPKMVELSSYNGIPHLISPVVTDPAKASSALMWAVEEMTRRYELLAMCGCKKLSAFNEQIDRIRAEVDPELNPLPYIVIVIDELADLMMTASAEVESSICRLAQMARAVGMHLIIATQRPSVNVLTGLIKANLPTRIAFSVTSVVDSKTILDAKGAEKLLGKGDMLFIPKGRNKPLRLQGAFVSDRELMDLVNFVKEQAEPEYLDIEPEAVESENEDDEVLDDMDPDEALVMKIKNYLSAEEKTSTSMLQRKFRIGYNRAARIMDRLEEEGLVAPSDGSNRRQVLMGRSNSQI